MTHGGAANAADVVDGCARACSAALAALAAGARALDAAVAAVVVLEDDPRMNAGTGSTLRLDGRAQMDASVMDGDGFGACAVVEDVLNPVKLARAIYGTPHRLLAGAGADELAVRLGLARAGPVTERQREKHAARMRDLEKEPAFARMWAGLPTSLWKDACDTVGAVVRGADGSFAAAASTGGIWCALRGRVGDVPIPGAGVYVGRAGAVAATGVGEVIWQEMLSIRVHDAMARGMTAQEAVDDALALVRARYPGIDVGVLAVDATSHGGGATTQMPWCAG